MLFGRQDNENVPCLLYLYVACDFGHRQQVNGNVIIIYLDYKSFFEYWYITRVFACSHVALSYDLAAIHCYYGK